MKPGKLNSLHHLLDKLAIEAKEEFANKFPYLELGFPNAGFYPGDNVHANRFCVNMPETDDGILVRINCDIIRPFSTVEKLLFDKNVAPLNVILITKALNHEMRILLDRFYYHTIKKFVFSM